MTSPAILENHDIAVTNIELGHFSARSGWRIGGGDIAKVSNVAAVWRALQDDRETPWDHFATTCRTIHIGRQMHAISQCDAPVALQHHVEQRRLRPARPAEQAEQKRADREFATGQ